MLSLEEDGTVKINIFFSWIILISFQMITKAKILHNYFRRIASVNNHNVDIKIHRVTQCDTIILSKTQNKMNQN